MSMWGASSRTYMFVPQLLQKENLLFNRLQLTRRNTESGQPPPLHPAAKSRPQKPEKCWIPSRLVHEASCLSCLFSCHVPSNPSQTLNQNQVLKPGPARSQTPNLRSVSSGAPHPTHLFPCYVVEVDLFHRKEVPSRHIQPHKHLASCTLAHTPPQAVPQLCPVSPRSHGASARPTLSVAHPGWRIVSTDMSTQVKEV